MAEYGKLLVGNSWLLGRQTLVGIESATLGQGDAVIGFEDGKI